MSSMCVTSTKHRAALRNAPRAILLGGGGYCRRRRVEVGARAPPVSVSRVDQIADAIREAQGPLERDRRGSHGQSRGVVVIASCAVGCTGAADDRR
jgi:hypothetical protein